MPAKLTAVRLSRLVHCGAQIRKFAIGASSRARSQIARVFVESAAVTESVPSEKLYLSINKRENNVLCSPFPDVAIPKGAISYPEFVFRDFDNFRERTAVESCDGRVTLTYEKFRRLSRDFSANLASLDIGKRDAVGFYLHNSPEFGVCFYGTLSSGATVAPCNPIATASELVHQLRTVSAKVLVASPLTLTTALQAAGDCPSLREIIVAELNLSVSSVGYAAGARVTSLDDVLAAGRQKASPEVCFDAEKDVAIFAFSSGTTGLPKAIALSHRNLIANLCQATGGNGKIFDHRGLDEYGRTECTVAVMPFFHIYGMIIELGGALLHGAKIVTMSHFRPKPYLEAIQKHRASQLHSVPPLSLFLAQSDLVPSYDLSSIRSINTGGSPMPEHVARLASERLGGIPLRQAYGMTELSPLSHASPIHAMKYGTVGVPVPNTQVKVADINTGEALPMGREGEICVKGPQVMLGYLQEDRSLESGVDSDGWLHTGDIGCFDSDGYFKIVDRLKELIKVKGFQVAPAELESILLSHSSVADAAVIGIPDERCGEVPRAYIVASPRKSIDVQEVKEFVARNVSKYKRLAGGVELVDAIPKSMSGKILRRKLKELAVSA